MRTAFISDVHANPKALERVLGEVAPYGSYDKRQINCQAAAAALYVSLRKLGKLEWAMASRENFMRISKLV